MVQSIHRAFDLLAAIAVEPAGVTELARRANLPKSTTARLLATLEAIKAIERTEASTYRLGSTLNTLASSSPNTDLASVAIPHLQHLTDQTQEASGLSVPDGYRVHYIAQVDSNNPVQIRDWTGELIPMHAISAGQVFISEWPPERLDRYFSRPVAIFTKETVRSRKQMQKKLKALRTDGYVWVMEEFAEGLNSVAAPVRNNDGGIVAAVTIHGPAYRFPADQNSKTVGELVVAAADRLARSIIRVS